MASVPHQMPSPEPDGGPSFQDGLGIRYVGTDTASGDRIERLCVTYELARQAAAIEERVARLSNFRHPRFARVRGVEIQTLQQAAHVVWVHAEPVDGVRLSELLTLAEQARIHIDVNAALQVVREVLPALATLHDSRNVTHGAIAPSRLVLTPLGRISIVDHYFGAALARLQYPRSRLWREFRVAMPPAAGIPRFDQRADVAMVAITLLALLVGRTIALNEFPDQLRDLLDRARERPVAGRERPLSASLRAWLERALPIESRRPLTTALEAQLALEDVLKKERCYAPGASALRSFAERVAPIVESLRRPRAPVVEAGPPGPTPPQPPRRVLRLEPRPAQPAARLRTPEEEEAEEIAFLERELARLAAEEAAQSETALAKPEIPWTKASSDACLPPAIAGGDWGDATSPPSTPVLVPAGAPGGSPGQHGGQPDLDADAGAGWIAIDLAAALEPSPSPSIPADAQPVVEVLAEVPLRLDDGPVVEFSVYAGPANDDTVRLAEEPAWNLVPPEPVHVEARPPEVNVEPAEDQSPCIDRLTLWLDFDRMDSSRLLPAKASIVEASGLPMSAPAVTRASARRRLRDPVISALAEALASLPGHAHRTPSGAAPHRRLRPRSGGTRPRGQTLQALPAPASDPNATLAPARAARSRAVAAAIATAPPLRLVAAPARRPRRQASPAALPSNVDGLASPLARRHAAPSWLGIEAGPRAVLRLVPPRPSLRNTPRPALTSDSVVVVAADLVPVDAVMREAPPAVVGFDARRLFPVLESLGKHQQPDEPPLVEADDQDRASGHVSSPAVGLSCTATMDGDCVGVIPDTAGESRATPLESPPATAVPPPCADGEDGGVDVNARSADSTLEAGSPAESPTSAAEQARPVPDGGARAEHVSPEDAADQDPSDLAWHPPFQGEEWTGAVREGTAGVPGPSRSAADGPAGHAPPDGPDPWATGNQYELRDLSPTPQFIPGEGLVLDTGATPPAAAVARTHDAGHTEEERDDGALGPWVEPREVPVLRDHHAAPSPASDPDEHPSAGLDATDLDAELQALLAELRAVEAAEEQLPAATLPVEELLEVEVPLDLAAEPADIVSAGGPSPHPALDVAVVPPATLSPMPPDHPETPAGREGKAAGRTRRRRRTGRKRRARPEVTPAPVEQHPAEAPLPPVAPAVVRTPDLPPATAAAPSALEERRPRTSSREAWTVVARRPEDLPRDSSSIGPEETGRVRAAAEPPAMVSATADADVPLPVYAPWLTPEPVPPRAAEAAAPMPVETTGTGPVSEPAGAAQTALSHVPRPVALPRKAAGSVAAPAVDRPVAAGAVADISTHGPLFGAAPGQPTVRSAVPVRLWAAALLVMVVTAGTIHWWTRPAARGLLVLEASIDGIAVSIDGQVTGQLPLAVELEPGRHVIVLQGHGTTRTFPVEVRAGSKVTQLVTWPAPRPAGALRVTSTPPGARVLIGGEMRGVTPVEITDVVAGTHTVVVENDSGSVRRSVKVEAGETTSVDVAIFSGWLQVFAPFRVNVLAEGRVITTSEDGKVLLPPGSHKLELVNATLGVRETRTVEITPGATTTVSLEAPSSAIGVEAPDGTEVWIDGELRGTTPSGPFAVKVGTREVVLRHARLGQRRVVVQVGATTTARVSFFTP